MSDILPEFGASVNGRGQTCGRWEIMSFFYGEVWSIYRFLKSTAVKLQDGAQGWLFYKYIHKNIPWKHIAIPSFIDR